MNTIEDRNVASGLCMTCNHAGSCVYLANANRSIWCCEEFDDRPPVSVPQEKTHQTPPDLTVETTSVVAPYAEDEIRKVS